MIDYAKLAEVLGVELGDAFYTQNCCDICNYGQSQPQLELG